MPRCFSRMAIPRPEKPLPTMTMSNSVLICAGPPGGGLRWSRLHTRKFRERNLSREMAARVDSPTRMTASERREQLLDVTKAIVAERGFHAVSIEAVAREAGITRPIVYGHFADLQGLLEALVDPQGRPPLAQPASVLPVAPDPR